MSHKPPSPPDSQFGGLDFEFTDFSDARRSLDELPAGVTRAPTLAPGFWEKRRRAGVASDRALTGQAIGWLLALPPELRPKVLTERFPRIANVLADCWARPLERRAVLRDLLVDLRGGRRGFPALVQDELQALRSYAESLSDRA